MARTQVSSKHMQISKATAMMVSIIAAASFITVFSVIACQALLSQRAYQSRVIAGKQKAKNQLDANLNAVNTLVTQYKVFDGASSNVLGGNPTGTGSNDGDNAKIVLDALPSKYDFPALATSLEKLLKGYKVGSISGNDDAIAQASPNNSTPQPVEMPFQISLTSDYQSSINFLTTLERSIRPIKVNSLTITTSDGNLSLSILANTYYQPSKNLTITTKVVK